MHDSDPAKPPTHLPALDALRGVAILLVLVAHLGLISDYQSAAAAVFRRFTAGGWVGVDLFFVLSGFLITRILLREVGRPGYFRNFYARRTLRIFPLYYGVLIVTVLLVPLIPGKPTDRFGDGHWTLWPYLTNLWIAFHGQISPIRSLTVNHFWSLAVEEQFYLVWPAVVLGARTRTPVSEVLRRPGSGAEPGGPVPGLRGTSDTGVGKRLMIFCMLAIATAFVTRILGTLLLHQADFAYTFTFCRIDGLAAGGLVAIVEQSPARRAVALRVAKPAAILAAVALAILYGFHPDLGIDGSAPALLTALSLTPIVFAGLIAIVALNPAGPVSRLVSHRPLGILGRYSYGMYVFHALLLLPMSTGIYVPLARTALGRSHPLIPTLIFMPVASAVVFAIAVVSFHVFEMPFLRLKRFFAYR